MMYSRPQRRIYSRFPFMFQTPKFLVKFVVVPNIAVYAVIYHLNPVCTPTEHFRLDSPSLDYTARVFPVEEIDSCVLVYSLCNKCIPMDFPSDSINTYTAEMDVDILLD